MITGSAQADAALLIVDAEEGVREQTRRHAFVLSLLGIRQILVVINKLDRVDFSQKVYGEVTAELTRFLHSLNLAASFVVPISARDGDFVVNRTDRIPWYNGPTVVEALDEFTNAQTNETLPLRMPIQDIYKWDNKRIYVGRVESGRVSLGDRVVVAPTGKTTRVKSIEIWGAENVQDAWAGQSVGLTLEDELYAERGHVVAHADSAPVAAGELVASLFWLGAVPFTRGRKYRLRLATVDVEAEPVAIEERIDSSSLEVIEHDATELRNTETGRVRLRLKTAVAADAFDENMRIGRFVLLDGERVAGGGIVRSMSNGHLGKARRIVRLSGAVTSEPVPNLLDLRRENAVVEFEADAVFLDALARGERYVFHFNNLEQIEPLTRLAYEHDLVYTFRRESVGTSVLLQTRRVVAEESEPPRDFSI
jgi:bifunctional enzyme CysN/CysC/sulfate adenylyltransferase subunit 1